MRIFRSYLSDLEGLKNSIPKKYFEMANNIARKIPREYSRIGVLDLNDIIQESNLALVTAWGNIKWNYIKSLPKKEQESAIHGYLYKSIELMMHRRINNQSEGIRMPEKGVYDGKIIDAHGNKRTKQSSAVKKIITTLYPQWFKEFDSAFMTDEIDDYANEQLMFYLDDLLHEYLNQIEYQIIMWSYGIDCEKKTQGEIIKMLGMKQSAVSMRKKRAMTFMQESEEFKNKLAYYIWTEGVKTGSDAIQWANDNLKLFKN